ncbi:MAG: acetyl-CoA carboxylase biotin carboxyl carrier protein [Verrucomicrobiae bacterium]|nr:acetyl-CoA carboxylase biotin carboxyl carrier protein [Verrucomicrobiae bacterium]
MDLRDIKAIIDLMKKNSIQEFEMERQDFKIRLRRSANGGSGGGDEVAYAVPMAVPVAASAAPPALPVAAPSSDLEIKSPMIGTLYRAPSPEAGHYVEVGSEVGPDTVVCIIEAMKVMNEIKAETRGVITQILVDNAKPVEFGQPLFKLRPV